MPENRTPNFRPRSAFLRTTHYFLLAVALAGCDAGGSYDPAAPAMIGAQADAVLSAAPVISALAATPSSDGATITWTTNKPADSQVQFGPTSAYGRFSNRDATLVTSHKVVVTGLAAGTWHYRAWTQDASWNLSTSPDMTFTVGAAPPPPPPPPVAASHRRCGWMFTNEPSINAVFIAHAGFYEAIHPVWYALNGDGVSIRTVPGVDDASVTNAARSAGTKLIPTVASVESAAWTRAMLYSPSNRAAHIKVLVNLAVTKGYPGLDLDYEHLWDKADAAPLSAFVHEVSAAMHAAGKTISMAVPSLTYAVAPWNYPDLAANLDVAHLMGYDFHSVGGDHAGPTAPVAWIDAVAAQTQATGKPERFVLGVPNYGITRNDACTLTTCAARCTGAISTTSNHMQSCPNAKYAPEHYLSCNTASGTQYWDDLASLEAKIAIARNRGLGGISYWQLGGELGGFWEMVRRYY